MDVVLNWVLDVVQVLTGRGSHHAVVQGVVVLEGWRLKLCIDGADGAAGFLTPPDEPEQQGGGSEQPDRDQDADQQGELMVCSEKRGRISTPARLQTWIPSWS